MPPLFGKFLTQVRRAPMFAKFCELAPMKMPKHIWHLFTDGKDSLWTLRIRANLIRGRPFWGLKFPGACSWSWQKILQLRDCVKGCFRRVVGNGESTFLWYDNWHPSGPLERRTCRASILSSSGGSNAKVSSIIDGSCRKWPTLALPQLWRDVAAETPISFLPAPSKDDSIKWVPALDGCFSVGSAYNAFRISHPIVPWHHLLWFKDNIPRFSFILWLAIKERLSTQSRLKAFGLLNDITYVFCGDAEKDFNRLFFDCPFSNRIWVLMRDKYVLPRDQFCWQDTISWAAMYLKGNSFHACICKLILSATVYGIWKEHNQRLYCKQRCMLVDVLAEVVCNVKDRVALCRFPHTPVNLKLAHNWNICL
ncbi:hypothetical protein CJ030_MR0G006019 [Morella rubra]|uniref:Reverse transcriptase zinc-binding domain-containing protein n=1 Tax=Morella rubra TaxID=262757 RepID=A0A6A1UKQ8_9ROSI|nr:hypothetical protein CJ030_MR0G006019 [Morella rubra]